MRGSPATNRTSSSSPAFDWVNRTYRPAGVMYPTVLESPPCSPVMMLRLPEFACQSSGTFGCRIGKSSSRASYFRPASTSKLGTGPAVGPPGLKEHWLAMAATTTMISSSGISDHAMSRVSWRMRGFWGATPPV